jgi:acetylornithine deacetylase
MDVTHLLEKALPLLKELIATPSISRTEDAAAEVLYRYICNNNLTPKRIGNNIVLHAAIDTSKPTLLLNSHIDTVKPVSTWTKQPYEPLEVDGCIYGLGSNDAGASVVSLLGAYVELQKSKQPYNLVFLASVEEEISGKNGIEEALKHLPEIDFAIVGEPTDMQPAIAEKGLMVIDGVMRGKSGHAARDEGENAIYKVLEDVEWFKNYKFPLASSTLGEVKMSLTQIESGTQHNVVPDECHFVVDVRTQDRYDNKETFKIIQSHVNSELKARSFRLNPSFTPVGHPFMLRTKEKGLSPFGSSTLSDQALLSCPSVKIGPGQSERSHSADEFIKVSEIQKAIELYIELLDNLEITPHQNSIS